LKKYILYIAVILIVVFSSFILSDKLSYLNDEKELIAKEGVKPVKVIEKSVVVERFSKQETQQVSNKLDALLNRINKRHDFHGSLLVAKKGKIVYNNQVGYKNFGRKKEPLDEKSTFQLASVSKQFTAAAIMILFEKNKIKLSDTVNKYFPNFPYENVTIKNLLNHTSGLPKYFWAEHKWKQKDAPVNSEIMQLLETSNVQRFYKPGYKFDYSNTGYLVLASIVEKVSEMSFDNFVEQYIFNPLGMNDSYVYSYQNDEVKPDQLDGYRIYRKWKHLKIGKTVNDAVVGDKNVYATAEDLYKWTVGLNNGSLFSKETLDLMYTTGTTSRGKKVPYGFGFRIKPDKQTTIYHHGKWNGFRTGLTQYFDDDLVVILLEHTSYEGIAALNNRIKKIVSKNFKF